MNRLDSFARLTCTSLSLLGGLMLLAAAFYVSAEVIGRRFFAVSLAGANELSAYAMAISSALAFSYALIERAHIRIDALYQLLSRPARALIDVLSMASLAGFSGLLVWFAFRLLAFAWVNDTHANTPLRTPMWLPLLLWYAGLVLFFLVCVLVTIRAALAWARGHYGLVARIAGLAGSEAQVDTPDLVTAAGQSAKRRRGERC